MIVSVYVAPPTLVGAWSMALGLQRRIEFISICNTIAEETCGSDYLGCGAALCAIISGTAECYCEPGFSLNQALTGCEGERSEEKNIFYKPLCIIL